MVNDALAQLLLQPDGSYDSLPACVEYLEHYGVRDKVGLVVAKFEQLAGWLADASFGLVFVDGDHSYERAYYDGAQALRLAKPYPRGRVVFHDYEATWPDVIRAVGDLSKEHDREILQLAGALAELGA